MPRFSSKAKKVYDLIWYKSDIKSANALVSELTTPVDIIFAKFWTATYYLIFFQRDLYLKILKEVEENIKSNPDELFQYHIKSFYFFYFSGFNSPTVSFDLANKYYSELEAIYPQIAPYDDWEKFTLEGDYYHVQGFHSWRIENNLTKGIEYYKKCIESFSQVPVDGDYLSKFMYLNNLGLLQRLAGYFDESEKNFLICLEETQKYDNLWQKYPLGNLLHLHFQKGEIKKAIELNEQLFKVSSKFNDIVGIYGSLEHQGDLCYAEGNYQKALEAYQESLTYRKAHTDGLELFKGYGKKFNFFYQSYKISKDKDTLQKAEQVLSECTKLHESYPDDETIKNYTNFYQACIFKYGSLNKRAKAGDIFEELIKLYPYTWQFVGEYLELLFEDYLVSEAEETISKIDALITKIYDIPLSITSIDSFVHQQLILSKYQFYIKNDITEAFELLNKAKEKIAPYKLEFLNSKLDSNLKSFRQDREKWDNIDITIKERIKKSEFDKYIQEALKMKIL